MRIELMLGYMNMTHGRVISNESLSRLVVSVTTADQPAGAHVESPAQVGEDGSAGRQGEYNLLFCAPHFIGDGTALHQSTQELLVLLASSKSDEELRRELEDSISESDWVSRVSFHAVLVPARSFLSLISWSTSLLPGLL